MPSKIHTTVVLTSEAQALKDAIGKIWGLKTIFSSGFMWFDMLAPKQKIKLKGIVNNNGELNPEIRQLMIAKKNLRKTAKTRTVTWLDIVLSAHDKLADADFAQLWESTPREARQKFIALIRQDTPKSRAAAKSLVDAAEAHEAKIHKKTRGKSATIQ